jgi:hypothetical protein
MNRDQVNERSSAGRVKSSLSIRSPTGIVSPPDGDGEIELETLSLTDDEALLDTDEDGESLMLVLGETELETELDALSLIDDEAELDAESEMLLLTLGLLDCDPPGLGLLEIEVLGLTLDEIELLALDDAELEAELDALLLGLLLGLTLLDTLELTDDDADPNVM